MATDDAADFTLGVLMLNTRFPRPPGDIGNPASFCHRVLYATVDAARVPAVVSTRIDEALIEDFAEAGQTLIAQGADMLATSCGFVCAIHDRLQARLPVPLVSSALNLTPVLASRYAEHGPVGVMTFDANTLSEAHFGRFWRSPLVIQGLQESREFYPTIRYDRERWRAELVEAEIDAAAAALIEKHLDTAALLLECTNLSPYRERLAERARLPVYDIHAAIDWVRRHGPF